MTHQVLDLFSGIGGFSLGLDWAGGFETAAFCENDKHCRKVLGKHWPNVKIYEDIRDLTNEQLQADGIQPTIITGGFPCQDISAAGKGIGIVGDRSILWKEMLRLIADVRPQWAIAENVSALRSRGLAMVLQDLSEIGYRVEWHCIPAIAVGARHRRDRIWIIAHRNPDGKGESALPKYDEVGELQEHVPDTHGEGAWEDHRRQGERVGRTARGEDSAAPKDMANTYCERVQEHWSEYQLREAGREEQIIWRCRGQLPIGGALESVRSGGWWDIEPELGRVAHGVPNRTHRLKQIGNAVVPQIPMVIGMAINSLVPDGQPNQEVY